MKINGRDLISRIASEEMPDLEQIRETCHRQAISHKPIVRNLRWSSVAVVVGCLIFATAVYAATVTSEWFDTGGSMAYILVPRDSPEYQEQRENMLVMRSIYFNERATILPSLVHVFSLDYFDDFNGKFDAETARIINEMLENEIFTIDGTPFELMTAMRNSPLYRADDRGNVLYTYDGYEIGAIQFPATMGGELLFEFKSILTKTEVEQEWGFIDTYENAQTLLGQNFRLPTVHLEEFDTPRFRIDGASDNEIGAIRRVSIRYVGGEVFNKDLILSVENIRSESVEPFHLYVADEVTELEIAGVIIHKFAQISFWWIHDGLVYSLIPPITFTDRQVEDVIRSMIE